MEKRFNTQPIRETDSFALNFLYKTAIGRLLLKPLIRPTASKLAGYYLNHPFSKPLIQRFVQKHGISLTEYEPKDYASFNDFFMREIKASARPFPKEEEVLVAPCDGKLTIYPIEAESTFRIKNSLYSMKELLGDAELGAQWSGGTAAIFRLTPDDYHHYYFIDDGEVLHQQVFSGKFHTVRPIAIQNQLVFTQNTRECAIIETAHFGKIAQIEVGALLVGKIKNKPITGACTRFEKKGWFEFGGSTVILLFQANKLIVDPEILANSRDNKETVVQLGQVIGKRK